MNIIAFIIIRRSIKLILKKKNPGNSLVVQWLGVGAFTAKGVRSIPGWRTKTPQAAQHGKKTPKDSRYL